MLAVIKKEFKSYLLSPIGYVFIGLFLIILSIFFYSLFISRVSNFEYLFYNGATILTFVTPLLTMRMFSEERKSGTEQLILTSPRSITSIVLGKFCAAGIMIAITEVFTLIYYFILVHFGKPSLLVSLTTLLGFFLLSLAYISFGMFISSITENQIIAAVITIGGLLALWFVPDFNSILSTFSLIAEFEKFPNGLITSSGIISFVSFSLLFILLTIITLQRRKSTK